MAASFGIGDDARAERLAKIYNASTSGFCFTSESKLRVGEEIQLAVDLDTTDEVIITVKVVWIQENGKGKKYTVGVRIVEREGPGFERFIKYYNKLL